jgi:outer membrane protein
MDSMKYGLLVLNVILLLAVGYLMYEHFNKKETANTVIKTPVKQAAISDQPFRIAYFEMDSIEANFNMVKDIKTDISRKEEEYNYSLGQIDQTYKNKYNEYMQKPMTQTESEAAQMDLRQLEDKLKNQKQQLDQTYQDFVMRSNLQIKKEIEKFLREYNADNRYSYIISYEQGLFYYKDTAYNITSDVIKGLNEMYRTRKN